MISNIIVDDIRVDQYNNANTDMILDIRLMAYSQELLLKKDSVEKDILFYFLKKYYNITHEELKELIPEGFL